MMTPTWTLEDGVYCLDLPGGGLLQVQCTSVDFWWAFVDGYIAGHASSLAAAQALAIREAANVYRADLMPAHITLEYAQQYFDNAKAAVDGLQARLDALNALQGGAK